MVFFFMILILKPLSHIVKVPNLPKKGQESNWLSQTTTQR